MDKKTRDIKRVLLLNAGWAEMPLLEELKEMNYYVITSGTNRLAMGHEFSDDYICADYSDKEAILEIVRANAIDAVISNSHDFGIVTASYVAEKMGWSGFDTYENTLILHQKDLMKEMFERLKIRTPKYVMCQDEKEAVEYITNVEYPIIVKAPDQTSGVGINRANTREEALAAIRTAFDKSRKGTVVIEDYIIGDQESFVAFVLNGKVIVSSACDCYSPINPYLIQTETMPSRHYEEIKEELTNVVEKMFSSLGLVDGIITVQYIVKDGKPYIIELMRRNLGNQFLTPVSKVTGFEWYKAIVMSELGMDCSTLNIDCPEAKFAGHHAIMSKKNGIFQGYRVPKDILDHCFLTVQLFEKGQEIRNYLNEREGYIYYTYENRHELDMAAQSFNNRIEMCVDEI